MNKLLIKFTLIFTLSLINIFLVMPVIISTDIIAFWEIIILGGVNFLVFIALWKWVAKEFDKVLKEMNL